MRPANGKSLELAEEALNVEFKKCVEREQSDKKDVKKVAKGQKTDDVPVLPLDAEPAESKEEPAPQPEVIEPIPCMDGRRWGKSKKSTCNF